MKGTSVIRDGVVPGEFLEVEYFQRFESIRGFVRPDRVPVGLRRQFKSVRSFIRCAKGYKCGRRVRGRNRNGPDGVVQPKTSWGSSECGSRVGVVSSYNRNKRTILPTRKGFRSPLYVSNGYFFRFFREKYNLIGHLCGQRSAGVLREDIIRFFRNFLMLARVLFRLTTTGTGRLHGGHRGSASRENGARPPIGNRRSSSRSGKDYGEDSGVQRLVDGGTLCTFGIFVRSFPRASTTGHRIVPG